MTSTGFPDRGKQQAERKTKPDDFYGPRLPPGLQASEDGRKSPPPDGEQEDVLGPPLPPGFKQESDDEDTYGPALPPGFKQDEPESEEEDNSFGPPLPPSHQRRDAPSSEEEEEGEIIGPLPPSAADAGAGDTVAAQFEARAQRMKDRLEGKDGEDAPRREDWMIELPDNYKSFGMGPRNFRKNALPENDDRSVWTDTPAQQEKKLREKMIAKARAKKEKKEPQISERDRQIAAQVDAYNSGQRSKSLMDMHTTKRKRKQEEEEEGTTKERRPFDREIDLQVNRFDDAQRKNLIKKSAKLDTRFSHGKEKVFL